MKSTVDVAARALRSVAALEMGRWRPLTAVDVSRAGAHLSFSYRRVHDAAAMNGRKSVSTARICSAQLWYSKPGVPFARYIPRHMPLI